MSLNSLIISTLEPLGVPVAFHKYKGKATTYITFFEMSQSGIVFSDNEERKTLHSFQIDIWSKGDYSVLTNQVKQLLIAIGFTRTYETELYESETEIYHKAIRFEVIQ